MPERCGAESVLYIGVMPKAQTHCDDVCVVRLRACERPTANSPTAAHARPASRASLKLHDLKGTPHSLEDYRGKPVLLNFWATWCVPCAAEMPLLSEMQKQYQGKVVFIAASIDDEDMKPQIEAFIKKHQGEALTVMMGATLDSLDDFGVNQGMPGTVFIDAEGKIVDRRTGALKRPDLEQQLRKLAGEPEAGPTPTPKAKAGKKKASQSARKKIISLSQEISALHSRVATGPSQRRPSMKKYIVPTIVLVLVAAVIFIRYEIMAPARAAARDLEAINGITVGKTTEAELLGRPAFQKMDDSAFMGYCFYHTERANTF